MSLNHFSLTVSNLERSLDFYCDGLGLERPAEIVEARGDWIDRVTAFERAVLRIAFVPLDTTFLELIEYTNPSGEAAVSTRTCDAGNAHLAINVGDIEKVYRRLSTKGVRFRSTPQVVTSGAWTGYKIVYLEDPDGIVVELVQPLAAADRDGEGSAARVREQA